MRPLSVAVLADAPLFLLGMATVRGTPTMVLSASALLEGEPSRGGRWILLRTSQSAAVLEVDEVIGVRTLPARGELPSLLREVGAVSTIGQLDRELFVVLGGARQLSEDTAQHLRSR